jgi:hypothetical protein
VARQTGTLVGVYHGVQAGMEDDPEIPWQTVCEVHHNLVGHPTLSLAMAHASDPRSWCEDCQALPCEHDWRAPYVASSVQRCAKCHDTRTLEAF